ncbi:uncharacterized protein LOC111674534 isoform X2 [Lucilia cuprina]|uniref:uncharacterized protein LOC111674534 isoform X2 n=1 Tax=Lucilia cuprina TaxID=7375 RepID=UPI001F0596A1|nr:uncharacterized protein LOC111674534 isoform X2 [Lucilia cuprina]
MEIEEEEMLDAVTFPIDEIPEPIKVLDDIISEFEDLSLRPQLQNNGENQSEDDGYMSLSRKNMKEKRDSEEMSQTSSSCAPTVTPNESFDAVDLARFETNGNCSKEFIESKTTAATTPTNNANTTDISNIVQTTLPKARTSNSTAPSNNSNYSSLPCCGQRTTNTVGDLKLRVGSCNGERNALGIDISAVHKAVLKGRVAKLPEPILNEHPVTIYPGPKDGPAGARNSRPKRLQASVDKHKEVCHILNPGNTSVSSSSSSSSPASTGTSSDNQNHKTNSSSSNNTLDKFFKNTTDDDDEEEEELSEDSGEDPSGITISSESTLLTPRGIAWEIHFKDFKKKTKQHQREIKKKSSTNHTKQGNLKSSIDDCRHLQNVANNEEEFRCFEESSEILNSCVFRQSSMLGKGTFIIRRGSTKRPPRAMDIFSNYEASKDGLSESEPDVDSESERAKYMTNDMRKDPLPCDIIKDGNIRHSLDIAKPLTSPRERLSLNLESHHAHHNSLKKDLSPIQHLSKSNIETSKKGSLKSLDGRTSSESINIVRTPCHDEASGFDLKSSGASVIDPTNMFVYKQSSNGAIKGADFNELRSTSTTPHTDLAPTLEEDEEQLSDLSYSCAPLKQIENNISALLRGEIAVARMVDIAGQPVAKRPLEFRPGVHKSESAKEMKLSQNVFGPLPPSPPSSNPDTFDYNDLPLPPSPSDDTSVGEDDIKPPVKPFVQTSAEVHTQSVSREELRPQRSKEREKSRPVHRHMSDELPLPPPPPPPTAFENLPPAVPPHRHGHSSNTMKSWSIDSNYKRKSPRMMGGYGSGVTTPTSSHGPSYEGSGGGGYGTRRYVSYGTKRSLKQSPREEHRLQTSCSLPETPIFARGCDIPRTPYRRQNENTPSGSRTAPRSSTSNNINMGNSIVGISGGNTFGGAMCRQRSINHALASNEMLRLAGAPQRGWYPKQRSMRPASTENIDRISTMRPWDGTPGMTGTGQARKPLTLPPNLTPSFLNKSPREALRRVTSLLITKKKPNKDKRSKSAFTADHALEAHYYQDIERCSSVSTANTTTKDSKRGQSNTADKPKKKGIFKTLWKRTKHFSLDHFAKGQKKKLKQQL